MNELSNNIINFSKEYTITKDKAYLKKHGQFFTLSSELLKCLLESYNKTQPKCDVLEPSCGTGMIILECLKHINHINGCCIDAVELDPIIYNKTVEFLEDHTNVNIINADFLRYDGLKEYDLIIGNPPYFELSKDQKTLYAEEYNEIYNGKVNIYSLFIYKSIKLLKLGGELIFIIPKTILSSISFSKLRIFIDKNCNIVDIIKFDNNNLFSKALQSVIILKLQKVKTPNRDFKLIINNQLFFVKDTSKLFLDNDTTTISQLSCKVKTGSIVWNLYKDILNDTKTPDNLKLIMAENIKNNQLVLNSSKKGTKKQYLTINENNKKAIIKGPYIIINRIVSNGILNIYFEQNDNETTRCFIENHVNYITGSLENLLIIYNSLIDKKTSVFIKEFTSNTQVSQRELENIIPIFIKN